MSKVALSSTVSYRSHEGSQSYPFAWSEPSNTCWKWIAGYWFASQDGPDLFVRTSQGSLGQSWRRSFRWVWRKWPSVPGKGQIYFSTEAQGRYSCRPCRCWTASSSSSADPKCKRTRCSSTLDPCWAIYTSCSKWILSRTRKLWEWPEPAIMPKHLVIGSEAHLSQIILEPLLLVLESFACLGHPVLTRALLPKISGNFLALNPCWAN